MRPETNGEVMREFIENIKILSEAQALFPNAEVAQCITKLAHILNVIIDSIHKDLTGKI
jgi:hypothetical protein